MEPKRPTEREGVIEETGRSRRDEHEGRERPQRNEDVDGKPDPSDDESGGEPERGRERDPDDAPDDDLEEPASGD